MAMEHDTGTAYATPQARSRCVPKNNSTPVRERPAADGIGDDGAMLPADRCLLLHRHMARARAMEERMIKMSKSGEGYFWIGGPGEEAFNVCLGLQVKKGQGPIYDYLHLHYRNSGTMIAMGMELIDGIRQMAMTWTDPFSAGRNFASHYARKEWNVIPVSSVIEIQYAMAPGTALMQKRQKSDGVTIVVGGESGSAEGDFASCLLWSSRPANPLPVLMIVMNNGWGISTSQCTQHACTNVIDRGKPFGIPGEVVDGNDMVASWFAIERALEYCRTERKPYMLEAMVSRLNGHSSSSGAARNSEDDCITLWEEKLLSAGLLSEEEVDRVHDEANAEAEAAVAQTMKEARPKAEDVERYTYGASPVDRVYPNDYTGLP
jgi:2-oxoisovalerate dehydrogenase E1 component alpha subunit